MCLVPPSCCPPASFCVSCVFWGPLPPGWSLQLLHPHGEVVGREWPLRARPPMSCHGQGKVSADQPVCTSYLPFSPMVPQAVVALGQQPVWSPSCHSLPHPGEPCALGQCQSSPSAWPTSGPLPSQQLPVRVWKLKCPGPLGQGLVGHGVSLAGLSLGPAGTGGWSHPACRAPAQGGGDHTSLPCPHLCSDGAHTNTHFLLAAAPTPPAPQPRCRSPVVKDSL